jgi:hypothetical protein
MIWSELDESISNFETLVSTGDTPFFGKISFRYLSYPVDLLGTKVCDWRPAWEQAKEIQEVFKSGIRYPTKRDRDHAWLRFNNARNELSQKSNADRETVFLVSKAWRDSIFEILRFTDYSKIRELIIPVIPPTSAEEIKRLGEYVKLAGQKLSENKHQMLREHKDECFQRIQEVRESHDLFWGAYKEQRERKQQEYRDRIRGKLERIEANITMNQEKRNNAVDALVRAEANVQKVTEMLDGARGDEFREQVEGWLSEAEAKRDSRSDYVDRLDEWIAQDAERRNDILRNQR